MKNRLADLTALTLLVPVVARRVLDDLVRDPLVLFDDLFVVAGIHDAIEAATNGPPLDSAG